MDGETIVLSLEESPPRGDKKPQPVVRQDVYLNFKELTAGKRCAHKFMLRRFIVTATITYDVYLQENELITTRDMEQTLIQR